MLQTLPPCSDSLPSRELGRSSVAGVMLGFPVERPRESVPAPPRTLHPLFQNSQASLDDVPPSPSTKEPPSPASYCSIEPEECIPEDASVPPSPTLSLSESFYDYYYPSLSNSQHQDIRPAPRRDTNLRITIPHKTSDPGLDADQPPSSAFATPTGCTIMAPDLETHLTTPTIPIRPLPLVHPRDAAYHLEATYAGLPVRNVIVFGDVGVGKSSIINMLHGGRQAGRRVSVSTGTRAEVFKSEEYHKLLPCVGERLGLFKVHEMAGLNQSYGGSVTTAQAVDNLWTSLGKLEDGVHLLLLVVKGPRFTRTTVKNYELLKTLTEGEVPIALVVTGMENEPRPETWWRRSRGDYDKEGMLFDSAPICVTGIRGQRVGTDTEGVYDAMYEASISKIENLILDLVTTTPYVATRQAWISRRIVEICGFVGVKGPGFKDDLYNILLGYGIGEKKAARLASKAAAAKARV